MANVFGNQGQFLASDISNFIAQNINNPAAIANAASQYGISAQDIQSATGYTPQQQYQYFADVAGPRNSQQTGLEYLNNLYTRGLPLNPLDAQKAAAEESYPDIKPGNIDIGMMSLDAQKAAAEKSYPNIKFAEDQYLGGAGLPSLQPLTVEQLYTNVLGRPSDIGGAKYWTDKFGPTIDPNEIAEFKAAAAPELVKTTYQNVLGREADVPGAEYYTQQLQSGALTVDKLKEALAYGAQGLEDRLKAQVALGKDIFAPAEFLKGTSGMGYQDIINYINANIQDPVRIAQAAAQYGVDPNEILQAYQSQGQSPYSLQQIQNYLTQGKAGYGTAFDNLLASTFGADNVAAAKTVFKSGDFANKSLESIQEALQNSSQNRIQDAFNLSSALYGYTDQGGNQVAGVFGFDPNQKLVATKDLASGTFEDSTIKEIYNELLKTNSLTPGLQTKLMQHLAKTNPNAYVFEQNPGLRTIYTPIEKLIDAPKQPGQYGYYNNAPILSATEADRLLGGDVFKGGNNYFGYGSEGAKDNSLGWDLRSKYAGAIANGAGIFNVKATNDDIALFDKAEREIAKYGGVQTQVDPEGGTRQVVAVPGKDPETGQPYTKYVPVETFFLTSDYDPETGTGDNKYNLYLDTKQNLTKGADQLKLDPTKFGSTADLFRAVNDSASNLYVVTGRANKWDKEISEKIGLTGHDRDQGGVNHASVLYRKVGDKLVPVEILKKFEFDDPNTSRGFVGDLLGAAGQILSIPPIQMALMFAGGLPNVLANMAGTTAANVAASLGSSILENVGIGSLLANTGMSYAQIGALESLVGNALLQGGTSGLMTGMATGDLESALTSGLAGLVGSSVGGATQFGLGPNSPFNFAQELNLSPSALKAASEVLGGSAARAVTGQDPGEYAVNRLLNLGIGALIGTGAEKAGIPTKGPNVDIFKAMLPIITSRNVKPEDIVRLAKALDQAGNLKQDSMTA